MRFLLEHAGAIPDRDFKYSFVSFHMRLLR